VPSSWQDNPGRARWGCPVGRAPRRYGLTNEAARSASEGPDDPTHAGPGADYLTLVEYAAQHGATDQQVYGSVHNGHLAGERHNGRRRSARSATDRPTMSAAPSVPDAHRHNLLLPSRRRANIKDSLIVVAGGAGRTGPDTPRARRRLAFAGLLLLLEASARSRHPAEDGEQGGISP
jgi:hypothetical protein